MPYKTKEARNAWRMRPEVRVKERQWSRAYQQREEYKAYRRAYLMRPEVRERERMRKRSLQYKNTERRRILRRAESKKLEYLALVSAVTGHPPDGILLSSSLLRCCV